MDDVCKRSRCAANVGRHRDVALSYQAGEIQVGKPKNDVIDERSDSVQVPKKADDKMSAFFLLLFVMSQNDNSIPKETACIRNQAQSQHCSRLFYVFFSHFCDWK